jgi:hypothetical protein
VYVREKCREREREREREKAMLFPSRIHSNSLSFLRGMWAIPQPKVWPLV